MDDAARLDADHAVVFVHHVEQARPGRSARLSPPPGINEVAQGDPLAQTQFLAPDRFRHAEPSRGLRPESHVRRPEIAQQLPQLLAALGKPRPHDPLERRHVARGQFVRSGGASGRSARSPPSVRAGTRSRAAPQQLHPPPPPDDHADQTRNPSSPVRRRQGVRPVRVGAGTRPASTGHAGDVK